MATKKDGLFLSGKHQSGINNSQTDKISRFSNFNLNHQSHKCSYGESRVHTFSKTSHDKNFDLTVTHDNQDNSKSWKRSTKDLYLKRSKNSCLNFEAEEKPQKRWMTEKKDGTKNKNSSTLSLHIAAYENSIEVGANECDDLLTSKRSTAINADQLSSKVQDSFEFPRQMKGNELNKPQVQQFKTSQKLLSPNQGPPTSQIRASPQQQQNNMSSLLEFVKETKGSAAVIPAAKEPEFKLPKPTKEDVDKICRDVWLTLISSSHPQTAEAIENHFRIDNGYRLDKVSASLGFHSTEAFLLSDIVSEMIHPSIIKDELDEYGAQRFSAVSYDDITHITDLMSESALTEEEKEARKEYFRNAKYSKMEYQEKAIEMRQKLACLAHEFMEANSTDTVSWDQIQEAYLKKFGQQLNKKHLREAFPTGHPSRIVEVYMNDEFMLVPHPTMTGNLLLKFRRPYSEIRQLFEEAKNAVKTQQSVIKPLEYRTKDNVYVDYVRERQKKEVFLQRKASQKSDDFSNSSSPKNNSLQSTNKFENVGVSKMMKESEKLGNFNAKESSQNVVKPIEPYARDDPFVEKESEPNYRLPNPRIIVPRKARIDWEKC